jgi:hypothetical protein
MKFIGCLIVLALIGCEPSPRPQDADQAAKAWGKAMGIEDPGAACDGNAPYYCAVSDKAAHVVHSIRCNGSRDDIRCSLRTINDHR